MGLNVEVSESQICYVLMIKSSWQGDEEVLKWLVGVLCPTPKCEEDGSEIDHEWRCGSKCGLSTGEQVQLRAARILLGVGRWHT